MSDRVPEHRLSVLRESLPTLVEFHAAQWSVRMLHRFLPAAFVLLAAFVLSAVPATIAQDARPAKPASPKVAEIERKIEQAKAQVEAAQAALAALEKELADAQAAATDDLIKRARAGDEAAIRAVLDLVNTDTKFVAYDYGKIAKVPDLKPFLRVLDQVWPTARPLAKSKFVWMLGVNGTAEAAARLRIVLAKETDPDVIGNAIFALSRCPSSKENLAAVKLHMGDARSMANSFGFYPHGWYGPGPEGGKNFSHQPLRILAEEYVAKHDPANFATTPGELTVEPATIHCAGFVWEIKGDSNRNCAVRVAYRKAGTQAWKQGYPLLRCESWESPDPKYPFQIGEKLAGSIFDLDPDTEYEVKLTLADPDGGTAEKLVTTRTIKEPEIYAGLRTLYVVPGAGGGSGTQDDPFKGIAAADAAAQPGDVMLLQPGKYLGSVAAEEERRRRQADRLARRGRGQGDPGRLRQGRIAQLLRPEPSSLREPQLHRRQPGLHQDVRLARHRRPPVQVLQIQIRRHHRPGPGATRFIRSRSKVTGGRNAKNWFVLDNEFTGPKDWTKDRGSASSYGVNLSGARNIIAYNRITDFWDCISLAGGKDTAAHRLHRHLRQRPAAGRRRRRRGGLHVSQRPHFPEPPDEHLQQPERAAHLRRADLFPLQRDVQHHEQAVQAARELDRHHRRAQHGRRQPRGVLRRHLPPGPLPQQPPARAARRPGVLDVHGGSSARHGLRRVQRRGAVEAAAQPQQRALPDHEGRDRRCRPHASRRPSGLGRVHQREAAAGR